MERLEMNNHADIARDAYAAFVEKRRTDAEALYAADFTFTSPYDDAIGKAAFFARCWPNNERFQDFRIERVAPDSGGAFVTYLVTTRDGNQFRNTEYLTIRDGKIAKVDVYFGASYRDGTFVAKQPE